MRHRRRPGTKPRDIDAAGVRRVGRIEGVSSGRPVTVDGDTIDANTIVWACGYVPGFDWIDLDIFEPDGFPRHHHGIVEERPGLHFIGLPFLYSISSHTIDGVGRDATRVVDHIAGRTALQEHAVA